MNRAWWGLVLDECMAIAALGEIAKAESVQAYVSPLNLQDYYTAKLHYPSSDFNENTTLFTENNLMACHICNSPYAGMANVGGLEGCKPSNHISFSWA
jgi:hypothetical protein